MHKIHINCDLGEGGKHDAQIMQYVSACNIACGGHAGNEHTIRRTIRQAKSNNVEIGMHPSYPDKENFGRKTMEISRQDLKKSLLEQIAVFQKIASEEFAEITHLKFHGALYNDLSEDKNLAEFIIEILKKSVKNIRIFAPVNSNFSKLLKNDFEVFSEAFLDRNYHEDYSLISRQKEHAVITEKEEIYDHLISMFIERKITTISGLKIAVNAQTFCLHSDTKSSVEIIEFLYQKLGENNLQIYRNEG